MEEDITATQSSTLAMHMVDEDHVNGYMERQSCIIRRRQRTVDSMHVGLALRCGLHGARSMKRMLLDGTRESIQVRERRKRRRNVRDGVAVRAEKDGVRAIKNG